MGYIFVKKNGESKPMFKKLIKQIEAIEKEIEELEDFKEYLEGVLDIQRLQGISDEGWGTLKYKLLLVFGGPNIWVWTDGIVEAGWGAMYVRYVLSKKAEKKLRELKDYLDSIYED